MKKYDLIILGAGPGGYVAAIHAAILAQRSGKGDFSIAIIEEEHLGGTCLNWGCIPTKRLLAGAEILHKMHSLQSFGISVEGVKIDYPAMVQGKDRTVTNIRNSLQGLIASHAIEIIPGRGSFLNDHELLVVHQEQQHKVAFTHAIIATGSRPRQIPAFPFNGSNIHSSTSLLSLKEKPESLVIIGGGVIGCEFAYLFNQLGTKVTLLEAMTRLVPIEAQDLSDFLIDQFKKQGITVKTNVQVEGVESDASGIKVRLKDGSEINAQHTLVAIGRSYNTEKIGLEKLAIAPTAQGAIQVDERMRTSCPNIYAIGDVTGKILLAHVASHQGVIAVENIFGNRREMHYDAIPSVIFTSPEIGSVGRSLEKALADGFKAKTARFPFMALGKAQAIEETDGFAQLIVEEGTGRILGAQVAGAHASSLISEIAIAIAQELTVESIQETVHPHPTLSEAWHEAALLATGQALHLPPSRKR
jgi:dihydrolipoamide dehydrogenase